MIAYYLAVALSNATPATPTPVPTYAWQTYTYERDGFSVSFPSAPTFSTEMLSRVTMQGTESKELRVYNVSIAQGPSLTVDVIGLEAGADPQTVLQRGKMGFLSGTQAREISERKLSLGPYEGLEFTAATDAFAVKAREYVVGDRGYLAQVVTPIDDPFSGTDMFLDSFQISPSRAAFHPAKEGQPFFSSYFSTELVIREAMRGAMKSPRLLRKELKRSNAD